MGKWIDRTNIKYGHLTAKEYIKGGKWLCKCDCGNKIIVQGSDLTNGHTKSCGCLRKKYNINEHYFDKIDTEEKSYILGMICADGNLTLTPKNIKIDLNKDDSEVLEKILKAMDYNYILREYHQKGKFPDSDKIYEQNIVRLNITNAVIVKKLYSYGIIPNKSKKLDFNLNIIPKEFIKDFLRGMWDGNGSMTGGKLLSASLTSSSLMIEKLSNILQNEIDNLKLYYSIRHKETPEIKTLIGLGDNAKKLLDYIYSEATIYMERKYKKYIENFC